MSNIMIFDRMVVNIITSPVNIKGILIDLFICFSLIQDIARGFTDYTHFRLSISIS